MVPMEALVDLGWTIPIESEISAAQWVNQFLKASLLT